MGLGLVALNVSGVDLGVEERDATGARVEPFELRGDQLAERGDDVLGYMHPAVDVLDGGFDVGHEHRLAFAGGGFASITGSGSCGHEVGEHQWCAVEGGGQNAVLVHRENDGRNIDGRLVGFASLSGRQVHACRPESY